MARHPNVDIDAESDTFYGASLLIYAIFNNKYEATEALLRNGADPNFVDRNGETPLSTSMYHNEDGKENKYILLLLKHGANPNLITRRDEFNFESPLFTMSTSISGRVDAVKLLVETGKADINIRNWYVNLDLKIHEYNIMEYACRRKSWDVVYYLVEKQGMANYLDSLNSDGNKTLMESIEQEKISNTDKQLLLYKRKIQNCYSRMHSLHNSSAVPKPPRGC